jgi:hypothetical protein
MSTIKPDDSADPYRNWLRDLIVTPDPASLTAEQRQNVAVMIKLLLGFSTFDQVRAFPYLESVVGEHTIWEVPGDSFTRGRSTFPFAGVHVGREAIVALFQRLDQALDAKQGMVRFKPEVLYVLDSSVTAQGTEVLRWRDGNLECVHYMYQATFAPAANEDGREIARWRIYHFNFDGFTHYKQTPEGIVYYNLDQNDRVIETRGP